MHPTGAICRVPPESSRIAVCVTGEWLLGGGQVECRDTRVAALILL
jgi:hypothetical protein